MLHLLFLLCLFAAASRADLPQCDCATLVRAASIEPFLSVMGAPPSSSQCVQSTPTLPAPAAACNEPIAADVPDLRGVYGNPLNPLAQFIVSQCGDVVHVLSSFVPSLGGRIARDFVFSRGRAGDALMPDILTVNNIDCRPTLLQVDKMSPQAFRVTRYPFIGSPGMETFSLGQVPLPTPNGPVLTEALLISQTFPPGLSNVIALPRIAPAPANQFAPAECFAQCPDDNQAEPTAPCNLDPSSSFSSSDSLPVDENGVRCFGTDVNDVERVFTPCRNAVALTESTYNVTCGFEEPLQPVLEECLVARAGNVPKVEGSWRLSDGSHVRIEQCGDRVVLYFVEERYVFDFRLTGVRRDGALGMELPRFNGDDNTRIAAYTATVINDEIVLQNIADNAHQIRLGLDPSGMGNGNGRVLSFVHFDYAAQQEVHLLGEPSF